MPLPRQKVMTKAMLTREPTLTKAMLTRDPMEKLMTHLLPKSYPEEMLLYSLHPFQENVRI